MKIIYTLLLRFMLGFYLFSRTLIIAQTPIAIVDFESFGISLSETKALTNRLRNELHNTGSYEVIERGMMEEILKEQGFQQTGCTSTECLVEIGNIIGVRQILGGSISSVGGIFSVSARVIDVETGKILKAIDYDYNGEIGALLTSGMKNVALKLADVDISHEDPMNTKVPDNQLTTETEISGYPVDWEKVLSTQFFIIPTIGKVIKNDNNNMIGMKGFNLLLGYYRKHYFNPVKINSWNHYWDWGTVVIIVPYLGVGTEYLGKDGVFVGVSISVNPRNVFPNLAVGKYY